MSPIRLVLPLSDRPLLIVISPPVRRSTQGMLRPWGAAATLNRSDHNFGVYPQIETVGVLPEDTLLPPISVSILRVCQGPGGPP